MKRGKDLGEGTLGVLGWVKWASWKKGVDSSRFVGLLPFSVPVVMRVFCIHSPCLEEGGA